MILMGQYDSPFVRRAGIALTLYGLPFEHRPWSVSWMARCGRQIADTLTVLEADRAKRASPWWLGNELSHADVAVGCALGFLSEAHAEIYGGSGGPALERHRDACEGLPAFRGICMPITNRM